MEVLEYSNLTHSNIIPKKAFESLVKEVFGVISTNLMKSLGPLGSSATILDGMYTSATKDGFAIFKSMRFHNRYKSMIYNLIKDPCTTLNNTVGDGTTTAIALTNFLFQLYSGNMDDESIPKENRFNGAKHQIDMYHRLPREFNNTWDQIIDQINTLIQSYSTPLNTNDYETIYKIAYVTSNGDKEISENISNIYKNGKFPIIKIKNSPTNGSYTKPSLGFNINANLIDSAYVKNEDLSVEEKNIYVLIFNYKIDMELCQSLIIPLNDILRSHKKKLLIIAPMYDQYMAETVLKQYVNYEYQKYKELNLILSQYTKIDDHQLEDLSIILKTNIIHQDKGSKLISSLFEKSDGEKMDILVDMIEKNEIADHEYYELLGKADSAILSCNNGSLFRVNNIDSYERYNDVIRVVEKELNDIIANTDYERQSFAHKISEVRSRLSQLKMENYIYYVGANTALEKNIIEDSVDDVIKCVRSAIKSGIVPGCQLSIIRACNEITNNIISDNVSKNDKLKLIILEMISDAIRNVYSHILRGPNNDGIMKLIDRWEFMTNTEESINALIKSINEKEKEILEESIRTNKVFDLEKCEYSSEIITSAETDIRVLTAASQLIKLLISGNQCLFLDSEINNSHTENVSVY